MAQALQRASSQSFSFFFRVLQPGFSNRLTLPTKFVKNVLANEKSELGLASLVNPIGEIWHVEVYKHADEDMCIGGLGWCELAHAHNLGLGYFLVFRYGGDAVFDFRAFDLSTCEIAYPSIANWVAKKLKQTLPVLIDVEDEEDCSNPGSVSIESYSGYEKEELMKSNPAGGVCFEVKLSARYLYGGHVSIPSQFRESSGLWEQDELRLEDPKGRLWTVRIGKRLRPGRTQATITMAKGWIMFARGNKLEEGDRCIFELVSQGKGKKNVMKVKIIKKYESMKHLN